MATAPRGLVRLAHLLSLSLCAASSAADSGLGDASQLLQLQASAGSAREDGSVRGYFYDDVVDGPDVRAYEPPALAPEASGGPRADGSPGSRVLIMNSDSQGISAIDDVVLKLKILLMLASAVHAVPATGRPRTLLGGIWGNSTTDSWEDYVGSTPRLRHVDEIRCAEGQPVTFAWHERWLGDLSDEERRNVLDPSRPLCLVMNFLVFKMRPDWDKHGLSYEWAAVMSGHQKVRLWRSQHIMDLTASARREVPRLAGEFNVAHVRRGDFRHNCTSAERVVARMKAVDASRPWLVMTNAEDAWMAEFRAAADAAGVSHILEGDLHALGGLDDNFLRYQVLQCLYGYAVNRVYTLKSLQGYCRVPGQRVEFLPAHLCLGTGTPTHEHIVGTFG